LQFIEGNLEQNDYQFRGFKNSPMNWWFQVGSLPCSLLIKKSVSGTRLILQKVPTLLGMNHCWVVLTFWCLELVGEGIICIPFINGFQKERIGCAHLLEVPKNHITGFHP
jgi:hypothetical protein